MLLLVYEYLTGGGLWSEQTGAIAEHPLLAEGQSMVSAVAEDLARIDDVQLVQLRDARLPRISQPVSQVVEIGSQQEEREQLAHWVARTDGTILIAPEHERRLLDRCEWVERQGGRLCSPGAEFVELTTDKYATGKRLAAAGVPTPAASLLSSLDAALASTAPFPCVLKPVDGVGSLDTHLIGSESDWPGLTRQLGDQPSRGWIVQPYQSGTAVGVSALCGPRGPVLLPPCTQQVSSNGRFTYLGGQYPLESAMVARACNLARRSLAALPPAVGYVGIDMILGDEASGQADVVLEVNPRLTTSYIGLRHATRCNLAHAMLDIGQGRSRPLFFQSPPVTFDCRQVLRP